jgi:hypothetical protein
MTVSLNRCAGRTWTPPKETAAQKPAETAAPRQQVKPEATPTPPHRCDSFEQKVSNTVQAMMESAKPGCPNKKDKPAPAASTAPAAPPAPTAGQSGAQEPLKTEAQPTAGESAAPDQASSTPEEPPVDRAADKRASRGWKNVGTTILQSSDTDCGQATLFTLKASRGNKLAETTSNVMGWLKKKIQRDVDEINGDCGLKDKVQINLGDGTTASEMGALLGMQHMKVTGNVVDTRSPLLSKGLREGQMAVVLLDSNAVLPADKRQRGGGQLHWVTISGIDNGGQPGAAPVRYRVKDPSHGEYWVSANQLHKAVTKARNQHGSGGALLVDQDYTQSKQTLAAENLQHTAALGNGNGGGSRRLRGLEAG